MSISNKISTMVSSSKNRFSGDALEYTLSRYLYNKNIKCHNKYTTDKYKKFNDKLQDNYHDIENTLDKIMKDYFKLCTTDIDSFELVSEYEGRKGIPTDIILHTKDKPINISCKKNNISVKHQRPSGLHTQLNMSDEIQKIFREEYKLCNNKWFDKVKDKLTFDKIEEKDKLELYNDFNILVKKYLEKATREEIKYFYNFIISINKVHILYLDTRKNEIILYDYVTNLESLNKINSIDIKKQYLDIKFDNKINMNLRLHNASKRITKSLSLKYDTKITNIDDLCVKQTFKVEE